MATPDPRVDAYIDALPDWQQAICRTLRRPGRSRLSPDPPIDCCNPALTA